MHNNIRYMVRIIGILSLFLASTGAVYAQKSRLESENINTVYALEYLDKAVRLYKAQDYGNTLDYVKKGQSYDDSFADFSYLEALSLIRLGETRAKILEAAEQAVVPGLRRQVFNEEDAVLLLSRLYTETKQYKEAIRLLETLSFPSADRDYYHAAALYGINRDEQAREIIETALNRWSFDVRFPKLFFLNERNKPVSRSGKRLADMLIQQLYVWIDREPALAVYAAPFDPNPKENNRRLKVYRNMYKGGETQQDVRTRLAAVLAELRYGVIDEKAAVKEFFTVQSADHLPLKERKAVPTLYSDQLMELCRIVGMVSVRKTIANQLKTFSGAVLEDENNDGIVDATVFFEKGRPISAFFDPNQDEIYEYRAVCNFGTPDRIITVKNGSETYYDTYPAVRAVTQQQERKTYTMRPLSLKWEPITQFELDLRLQDADKEAPPFFTLRLRDSARLLQEHDFIFSVLYCDQPDPDDEEAVIRTHFEKGQLLSIETKKNNKTVALAQYRNGALMQKTFDYDGDGFFEVLEQYNRHGQVEKIAVDINKNKLFEYTERYEADGSIVKQWDENEDGDAEIYYTQFPSGDARTMWKHRFSGKPVSVFYKKGVPDKLTIGTQAIPIIKEPTHEVYWLEKRPSFSNKVAEKLEELFRQNTTEVESYTVMIGGYELYAVRSGGAVFVQLFEAPIEGDAR